MSSSTPPTVNLLDNISISSSNPMPADWGKWLLTSLTCKELTPDLALNRNFLLTLIHLYNEGQQSEKQIQIAGPLSEDIDFHRKLNRFREALIYLWEMNNKIERATLAVSEVATKKQKKSLEDDLEVLKKIDEIMDAAGVLAMSAIPDAWKDISTGIHSQQTGEDVAKACESLLLKTCNRVMETLGESANCFVPDRDYVGQHWTDHVDHCASSSCDSSPFNSHASSPARSIDLTKASESDSDDNNGNDSRADPCPICARGIKFEQSRDIIRDLD